MKTAEVQLFDLVSPAGEAPLPGNDGSGLIDEVQHAVT